MMTMTMKWLYVVRDSFRYSLQVVVVLNNTQLTGLLSSARSEC